MDSGGSDGDQVTGLDLHIVLVPAPPRPPSQRHFPHPFSGHDRSKAPRPTFLIRRAFRGDHRSGTRRTARHTSRMPPGAERSSIAKPDSGSVSTGSLTVLHQRQRCGRHG